MTMKERMDALTMNLELALHATETNTKNIEVLTANIEKLVEVSNRDAKAIATLSKLALQHDERIERLEGK